MLARMISLCLLALAAAAPVHAGFTVTIASATINSGDTATLDVTIAGPDRLDLMFAEFTLVPVGSSPSGGLSFATVSPGVPTLPPLSDASYAFAGNSFAIDNQPGNPASVYQTVWADDTYLTSDATLNGAGVDVSGGKLVTRLQVRANAALVGGGRYRLAYGAGSVYQNELGQDVPILVEGGEITVNSNSSVAAVSAPGGLALAASGMASILAGTMGMAAVPPDTASSKCVGFVWPRLWYGGSLGSLWTAAMSLPGEAHPLLDVLLPCFTQPTASQLVVLTTAPVR